MSNPEKGIYLGHLCQDLDLLFFNKYSTFGVFYSDKPITSRSPKWPHKMPLKTAIPCNNPKTWNKFCKETELIQEIGWDEGHILEFEENIRPAVTEILTSIHKVKQKILEKKLLENESEEKKVKVCNYCPVTGHSLCEYQNTCELRSD